MTHRDHDSLTWSLDYAARRLAGAFGLAFPGGVAGSHVLRGAWRAACRELRYLEMMVRRLIVFMAGSIAPDRRARGLSRPASPTQTVQAHPSSRHSGFALNEPLPSLAQLQAMVNAAPRALPARVFGAGGEAHPVVCAGRIAARFAALARVLDNPERYARLCARRLWRAGGRIGRVTLKLLHGLRPALARGGTLDLAASAYMEAERLCFLVLNRPPG